MILENISLKPYNTFGIEAKAHKIFLIESKKEIQEYSKKLDGKEIIIIGGGSNLLFTKDVQIPMIKNNIKGIECLNKNSEEVTLKVNAGENWHEFVLYCVEKGYAGIENLSLIPGSVGACPIQNIGAYGVEVKSVIDSVEAWDLKKQEWKEWNNAECTFEYRNSVFKQKFKNEMLINSVTFKLKLNPSPILSYGPVKEIIEKEGIKSPSLEQISNIIISIRQSKLPDPSILGNAGSFFKNPSISKKDFEQLQEKLPLIPSYPQTNDFVKIPAAWLIEQAGWKGHNRKTHGVHHLQCLVLVNFGGAKGNEILQLSQDIIDDVYDKFGVLLEREVNVI
ncbi:MAG: UDP-N-acetylmuramate dehydrogenase [Flavobacteriia bacterium]|nr:UDP-N-acetylmuramate dehydrogenase [Flavobacteriia bacterium]